MYNKLEIKIKDTITTNEMILNKVILPIRIPFVKRNKDYSLIMTDLEISVPDGYVDSYLSDSSHIDGRNVIITIKYDNAFIFYGYVSDFYKDVSKKTVILRVTNDLSRLRDTKITHYLRALEFEVGSYPDSKIYTDNEGFTFIQILWFLEFLFLQNMELHNYQLDISQVENTLFRYDTNDYIESWRLKIDLGMLICLNQPVTVGDDEIGNSLNDKDYSSNSIDGFEFLSYICSVFGWSLAINPSNGKYALYPYTQPATRNYSTAYNTLYSYSSKSYRKEIGSSGLSIVATYGCDIVAEPLRNYPYYIRPLYSPINIERDPSKIIKIVYLDGYDKFYLKNHFMLIKQTNSASPPVHDLNSFANIQYLTTYNVAPQFLNHKVEKIKRPIDISKPCVLSNTLVFNKNDIYSEIEQEDLIGAW